MKQRKRDLNTPRGMFPMWMLDNNTCIELSAYTMGELFYYDSGTNPMTRDV